MVAMLAAFGLLYVGCQLLLGAIEGYRNREESPGSVIVLGIMICVCLGCPVALYVWAVRKPK
jgi:divalent metal cation (Fe/Co/Zn/Cd) transporter